LKGIEKIHRYAALCSNWSLIPPPVESLARLPEMYRGTPEYLQAGGLIVPGIFILRASIKLALSS